MANIKLNNNEYPIPDSLLAGLKDDFIAHLGTIAGDGMKVVIGGVEYSVDSNKVAGAISEFEAVLGGLNNPDAPTPEEERLEGDGAEYYTLAPTALSFRSTAPLNELQKVQINGVTVDPSNYTLEEGSTIVTFPIEYLKTLNVGSYEVAVASDSKTVKGGFSVKAPELNEHGFYYNQPYTANLPMFGGDTAFFVREDGTFDIITVGKTPTTSTYTIDGNNIAAILPSLGTVNCTISTDGTSIYCNEVATNFVLNGSNTIAADDDYFYIYKEDLGGYEVSAIDKTKAEYGAIKTGINGIDTVKLADYMFATSNTPNIDSSAPLKIAPQIPDSVTSIGEGAFATCKELRNITIPKGLTSIGNGALAYSGLINVELPYSVTVLGMSAFIYCDKLMSIRIGNSITNMPKNVFYECENLTDITFDGTIAQWNEITFGEDWNYNVPATHVHCIDGDVAL